jgi:hypothetical protein
MSCCDPSGAADLLLHCDLLRPQKYDLVQQFRAAGITAVLNLTEPGEHPHCGDGLEQNSGYVL